jgi:outer membrane protein assembly factor BamE (lipoprotein component of BamABCDE complex)
MKNYKILAIIVPLMFLAGCASTHKNPDASNALPESRIEGNVPANAPFAKIKIGMSQGQVHSILGQPTDSKMYQTGKMWIPFYFGSDTHRTEERYKGIGRITYTGMGIGGVNLTVFKATYDPSEAGFQDIKN